MIFRSIGGEEGGFPAAPEDVIFRSIGGEEGGFPAAPEDASATMIQNRHALDENSPFFSENIYLFAHLSSMMGDSSRVAFAHLDLGIGGAEQLVVNAALALKHRGHAVTIYTTHHSPDHCFAPTRGDGELAAGIVVVGDWLPRSLLGRAVALCSTLRMLYLALYMVMTASVDVVICDGVSAPLPVFRWRFPVLFYCHFPDKLLCTSRTSLLKRTYRAPLDWLEEATTATAHVVVVNSHFTASVFKKAFPRIARDAEEPSILYPVADFASFTPPDWAAKLKGAGTYDEIGL